jgi:hypothetical protein
MRMNTPPSASGTQPPSAILMTLAPKNARSIVRKAPASAPSTQARSRTQVDLLPQHRAQYEPPNGKAHVVRVDTTASPDHAAAEALGVLGR